ncbi:MAG: hypothetical protein IPN93_01490 [Bacteroidetes bacterium]|jgi:hypothetical protein|nr:hypothetical protein [Bacteroidota bacterium]MBK7639964.1 hypothetical protein [Bacteroidota bacterium]MBK8671696.1 hypothetical protein [Bacteroidota bacterium]
MSQAKDIFFELITPKMEEFGFQFKKSKSCFEKTKGDLFFSIMFSWDGRGGTTYLNNVSSKVHIPKILKAARALTNIGFEACIWQENPITSNNFIPQMYSKKLIELANLMRFKEMSAMPFEEKYPIEKIRNTANIALKIVIDDLLPLQSIINNENDILDWYLMKAKEQLERNELNNISYYAFPIKLMCKKLKINEPPLIKEIDLFTKDSIDSHWNMQLIEFETLENRFSKYKM